MRAIELSKGYMVSEHIGWEWKWKKQLKGTLRGCLGYFRYFDFASRIYAYEPGLLYQIEFRQLLRRGHPLRLGGTPQRWVPICCLSPNWVQLIISTALTSLLVCRKSPALRNPISEIQVKWKW